MGLSKFLKLSACRILQLINLDRLMRFSFRHRLLVVMYHGVTQNEYQPPVWTQLPLHVFEQHIEWLSRCYNPVALSDVVAAIKHGQSLPHNSVLITFDDGLKNNYTVAYPVLKQYQVPGVIFLTVDFIGTERFFWVDELYMALVEAQQQGIAINLSFPPADTCLKTGKLWDAYCAVLEFLKRIPEAEQKKRLKRIFDQVSIDRQKYCDDFGLLSWNGVKAMDSENLIEFGCHTASHRILTSIPDEALDDELFGSRQRLEKQLGHKVNTFCYPNGRFGIDYLAKHREMLHRGGYCCAFSTNRGLCSIGEDHPFSIPRVSVGNDITSNGSFFRMNASGRAEWIRLIRRFAYE